MSKQILLSTTGNVNPVIIRDLGGVSFPHPTINFDLLSNWPLDKVKFSFDLQTAIDDEEITIIDENGQLLINLINDLEIKNIHPNTSLSVYVSKAGNNDDGNGSPGNPFLTIHKALEFITDASINKIYTIIIGPGKFIEDTITCKPYVSLIGTNEESTVLEVDDPSKNVLIACANSSIKKAHITGSSDSGSVAIYANNFNSINVFHIVDCSFGNNYTDVLVESSLGITIVYINDVIKGGNFTFTNGFKVQSSSLITPALLYINRLTFLDIVPPFLSGYLFEASGPGATLILFNILARNYGGTGHGVHISDGCQLRILSTSVRGFNKGLHIDDNGDPSTIRVTSLNIEDSTTYDIQIEHPSAQGVLLGNFTRSKVFIHEDSSVTTSYSDVILGDYNLVGNFNQGSRHDRLANLSLLLRETSTMGLLQGGEIERVTGLDILVSAGVGFLVDPVDKFIKEVSWEDTQIALTANVVNYIYVNTDGNVLISTSYPSLLETITLGRVNTSASLVIFISPVLMNAVHRDNVVESLDRESFGPIYISGSIVLEINTRELLISSGIYRFGNTRFVLSGASSPTFVGLYRDGLGGTTRTSETIVSNSLYDDGSGTLASISAVQYVVHDLYGSVDVENGDIYGLVYGQEQFASLILAEASSLAIPPIFINDEIVLIARIIVQQGAVNFIKILDVRPVIGFKASGISASSNHGSLFGLLADDHPQYFLVNGGRALTGPLDAGAQAITNAGLINEVNIESHASRHLPNGSDPITTGTPVSVGTSNSSGTNNALARNDHVHAHGLQTEPAQHALVTTSAHGFMSSTDKTKLNIVSDIELGYLVGVTSSIQSQLNNKQPLAAILNYITANGVNDSTITAHISTKITINNKGQLNNKIVYIDQANTFEDFNQIFRSSKLILTNPANSFNYTFVSSAITQDRNLTIPLLTQNETLAVVPVIHQSTPANPTGTTSITGAFMGLAISFTPKITGRLLIIISGNLTNSNNDRASETHIRYGTGTAPTNGTTILIGTVIGNTVQSTIRDGGSSGVPFSIQNIVSSLVVGTAIWIDLVVRAVANTASVLNLSVTVIEV